MLSDLIVGYLFLGGSGAGLLSILCLLEAASNVRMRVSDILPRDLFERAWAICSVVLVFAILLLVADLGHSDRVGLLFTSPTFTPLTIGAYALALALCVTFLCTLNAFDVIAVPVYILKVLLCVGLFAGIVTMLYTGVLLSSIPSVLAWGTPLVPVLFLLSSLSCGCALLFFAGAFSVSRKPFLTALQRIKRFDSVLLVLELMCLVAYVAWCLVVAPLKSAGTALTTGEIAPWFWTVLVACGIVLPLLLERFITEHNFKTQFSWAAGSVLAGGFMLRWCIVALAAFDTSMAYQIVPLG